MTYRRALLDRLARLQGDLSSEQARANEVERDLAKLREEMKHQAHSANDKAPRGRRFQRGALSADLTGLGFRPVDIAMMANKGQLRRKCTDVTAQQEYAGHPSNKMTATVYRPRLSSEITRQFEQYNCSKQSPATMDVTKLAR